MNRVRRAATALVPALVLAALAWGFRPSPRVEVPCEAGAYRLADGRLWVLTPLAARDRWRWLEEDGQTGTLAPSPQGHWRGEQGWTGRPHPRRVAFGRCPDEAPRVDGQPARRVPLVVREVHFQGRGVRLRGRLVLPPGDHPVPVVVQVHGSEDSSARLHDADQYLYAANGIGVFVFDKRGTGGSGGHYTQDFDLLADDVVAAVAEARRRAGRRLASLGLEGASQGGWVAPLAATRTPVDFVLVAYGLAEGPADEDRAQVRSELAEAGFDAAAIAQAERLTAATRTLMASGFERGAGELAAAKARYRGAPWWPHARGEYTGSLARWPLPLVRAAWPLFDRGTPWDYDPMPVLRSLDVPQRWILAGDDRDAPPAETRRRLAMLVGEGKPIDVIEFPRTDHGIVEFEQRADGSRLRTRYAEGYFTAKMDWIRARRTDAAARGHDGMARSGG